jgi:hypothetical protein
MVSEEVKLEKLRQKAVREKRKEELEKMLLERFLTPSTVRLIQLAGIVAVTAALKQMPNKGATLNALQVAIPGIGLPLIAADAGITSWEALVAIGLVGVSIPYLSTVVKEAGNLASGETQEEFGQKTLGLSGWLTGQGYLPYPG